MEKVRKEKGINEVKKINENLVAEWFMTSCKKSVSFPKVMQSYVIMAFESLV